MGARDLVFMLYLGYRALKSKLLDTGCQILDFEVLRVPNILHLVAPLCVLCHIRQWIVKQSQSDTIHRVIMSLYR